MSTSGSDLYGILGVSQDSSQEEIRRSYRKLALKYHPDKVSKDQREQAEIKFKDITHAYGILGDEDKRRDYDLYGEREAGAPPPGYDEGGYTTNNPFGNAAFDGASFDFSPDDFANFFNNMGMGMDGGDDMFGGMRGNPRRQQPSNPEKKKPGSARKPPRPSREAKEHDAGNGKTKDARFSVGLSLSDLYNGKIVKLSETRDKICGKCLGSGLRKKAVEITCPMCEGVGYEKRYRHLNGLTFVVTDACDKCHGDGRYYRMKDFCKECEGSGLIKETKILEFDVPKGSENTGSTMLPGQSDEVPGLRTGDVVLNWHLLPTDSETRFHREGNDLYTKVSIPLVDALCGFKKGKFVQTLDKRWLSVDIPSGKVIRPGDSIVIPNEGMPIKGDYRGSYGDLYVAVNIQFPQDNWALERNDFKKLRSVLDISYGSKAQKKDYESANEDECTKVSFRIKTKEELPLTFNSFNANTEVKNVGVSNKSKGWFSKWF